MVKRLFTSALLLCAAHALADEGEGSESAGMEEIEAPSFEELNDIEEPELGMESAPAPSCFDSQRIYRTRVVDSRNVIVWSPNRRSAHLLRLDGFCFGLRPGTPFAIQSAGSRVCGRGGDEVRTPEGRCRIVAVAAVPGDQVGLVEEQVRAEGEMRRRR